MGAATELEKNVRETKKLVGLWLYFTVTTDLIINISFSLALDGGLLSALLVCWPISLKHHFRFERGMQSEMVSKK